MRDLIINRVGVMLRQGGLNTRLLFKDSTTDKHLVRYNSIKDLYILSDEDLLFEFERIVAFSYKQR